MMTHGILVCGLNGAGKSTLAKALAERLSYGFIDIEELYFPTSNPDYLYADSRSFDEVQTVLRNILAHEENFILASVKGNFDEEIVARFTCAVKVDVPKEIRLERVYTRSYAKFGERMREGGDLYERETAFLESVKAKAENSVDLWLSTVDIPVIRVDGTLPIKENVEIIANKIKNQH